MKTGPIIEAVAQAIRKSDLESFKVFDDPRDWVDVNEEVRDGYRVNAQAALTAAADAMDNVPLGVGVGIKKKRQLCAAADFLRAEAAALHAAGKVET